MAQNELLELNGTVDRIIYRNEKNQYTVLELTAGDDLVTVVGSFPLLEKGKSCGFLAAGRYTPAMASSLKPLPLSGPSLPPRRAF